MYKLVLTGCLLSLFSFSACRRINVFEKDVAIKNQAWKSSEKPSVTFNIQDTTSLYTIYLVIRHSDAYEFNNLWLNIYTKAPSDTLNKQQLNIRLSNNTNGWLGTGMDDIFEHRVQITRAPVQLKKAGDYTFTLEQIMRQDPLEHVLNVGVRVERVR